MDRYDEIREYVNHLITDIEKMDYFELKCGCLFSLIDSFIQNYYNYDIRNNKIHFCDFILRFANNEKYSYLNEIDPVTLLYDFNNEKIEIEELSGATIYSPNSYEVQKVFERIDLNSIPSKTKNNHKFIELLYCCRSKILHEQQAVSIIGFKNENEYLTPIYMDFTSYWKLVFPYKFLKELFLDCINNYINHQETQNLDPFHNNFDRKSFYAFYD